MPSTGLSSTAARLRCRPVPATSHKIWRVFLVFMRVHHPCACKRRRGSATRPPPLLNVLFLYDHAVGLTKRRSAPQFSYVGWDHMGFASQESTENTIEVPSPPPPLPRGARGFLFLPAQFAVQGIIPAPLVTVDSIVAASGAP